MQTIAGRPTHWLIAAASLLWLAPVAACGDDGDGDGDTTQDTGGADSAQEVSGDVNGSLVTFDEVHGIFRAKCTPCHEGDGTDPTSGSGSHTIAAANVAVAYQAATKAVSGDAPAACDGKKVGECAHIRISDGSMPLGEDCADDRTQPECPTQAEIDLIQQWIADGMASPVL